jgi:hypothetical protein
LTEIGKAIRKLPQRRAVRQNERKRAIFEYGCHAAWSQMMFVALVHSTLSTDDEAGLAPHSNGCPCLSTPRREGEALAAGSSKERGSGNKAMAQR